MKINKHTIVSAIDDNYTWPLLVMLRSALENASEKFDVALGFDESSLSSINLEVIKNVCASWDLEISFFPIELDIEAEFDNYLTATTYARLILADNFIDPFI